jgi:hypothetical protein
VIEYAHSSKIKTLFTDLLHPMFHEPYKKAGFKEIPHSKKVQIDWFMIYNSTELGIKL